MKRQPGELRIIGGALRGRKWRVPDVQGLRPTPDRVRETLFNWLAPHVSGARVLDVFAGSGALGFEAASRGAAAVVLVEQDRSALGVLRETAARFGLSQARIEAGDALALLRAQPAHAFSLVFLDPPFASGLLLPALRLIASRELIAPGGFCYIEQPAASPPPELPPHWSLHRAGKAGDVGYHLLHVPPRDLSRNV